jgi:hypothetical protein
MPPAAALDPRHGQQCHTSRAALQGPSSESPLNPGLFCRIFLAGHLVSGAPIHIVEEFWGPSLTTTTTTATRIYSLKFGSNCKLGTI